MVAASRVGQDGELLWLQPAQQIVQTVEGRNCALYTHHQPHCRARVNSSQHDKVTVRAADVMSWSVHKSHGTDGSCWVATIE